MGLQPIKPHDLLITFDHVSFWDEVANYNSFTSTATVSIATKVDWIVTYFERLSRSRDKLRALYLHYYSTYYHQT